MVAFVKMIRFLIILFLINGKLTNAYSQKGVNIAAGGCNGDASNGRVRKVPLVDDQHGWSSTGWRDFKLRGEKLAFDGIMRHEKLKGISPYGETFKTFQTEAQKQQGMMSINVVKGQPNMKRTLLSERKKLAGIGAFTNDYDLGPMHHPPRNN